MNPVTDEQFAEISRWADLVQWLQGQKLSPTDVREAVWDWRRRQDKESSSRPLTIYDVMAQN